MINLILPIVLFCLTCSPEEDPYEKKRENMVRYQIENRGIHNKLVLQSMRTVKRHLFVPEKQIKYAYNDNPLTIGYGQTISQPYIVAYMTDIIDPKPHFKILEIGTGSGYQAAVLAEIVDSVYTVEIVKELYQSSTHLLRNRGYNNTETKHADGYYGWEEHAPYDAIIVTAAPEFIPPPLLDQLADGGKMIIPVGSPFMVQSLMLVKKDGEKVTTRNMMAVRFVPFTRSE